MKNRTIAIDVDGTLITECGPNLQLIEWIREKHSEGFPTMLWSMQGRDYARSVAERLEILDLFDVIASKPRYIVDDQGWQWVKYTNVIRNPKEI